MAALFQESKSAIPRYGIFTESCSREGLATHTAKTTPVQRGPMPRPGPHRDRPTAAELPFLSGTFMHESNGASPASGWLHLSCLTLVRGSWCLSQSCSQSLPRFGADGDTGQCRDVHEHLTAGLCKSPPLMRLCSWAPLQAQQGLRECSPSLASQGHVIHELRWLPPQAPDAWN